MRSRSRALNVYKFVQVIEPTVIDTRDVPGSVFGSDEASVQAEMVYAMTRTFYVEPATGAPVHRIEERDQDAGLRRRQACRRSSAPCSYTDDQVDQNVDDVATKATLLGGTRALFPIILVLLGVVLLGLGLVLNRRLSSDVADPTHKDKPLVTA